MGETLTDEHYVTWGVRWVAMTLGVDDRAAEVMDDFRSAVDDARGEIAAIVEDAPVGLVDVRADSILLSGYGSDGLSALLHGDLGLVFVHPARRAPGPPASWRAWLRLDCVAAVAWGHVGEP